MAVFWYRVREFLIWTYPFAFASKKISGGGIFPHGFKEENMAYHNPEESDRFKMIYVLALALAALAFILVSKFTAGLFQNQPVQEEESQEVSLSESV